MATLEGKCPNTTIGDVSQRLVEYGYIIDSMSDHHVSTRSPASAKHSDTESLSVVAAPSINGVLYSMSASMTVWYNQQKADAVHKRICGG